MDQKHDHRKLSVIMWSGDRVLILKQTTERVDALSVVRLVKLLPPTFWAQVLALEQVPLRFLLQPEPDQ